ncbi:MAG: HPP family protein [Thermincola sp.]|jgi:CBS-domain-containing membrane protein|nr:HPP family protein [Thermincola sp.]MDT3702729.1 HPP family protein [Thermincola sp.]
MGHSQDKKRQRWHKSDYDLVRLVRCGIGSFIGISIVAYLSLHYKFELLVPSFGASAVLLYAAPQAPMAHPKNVLGGHLISAMIGVTVYQLFGYSWWSLAIGVTLAILGMVVSGTTHPPGGATAFAAIATQQNYFFVLTSVAMGVVILIAVALFVNNFRVEQKWPHSSSSSNSNSKTKSPSA